MFITVTAIICGLFALFLGLTSNGMTSPRVAFNIYTIPFSAVLGAIIGIIAAVAAGDILHYVGIGVLAGAIAGFVGLAIARLKRGSW